MKCEICEQNEATVLFKQVVEGSVREMRVCMDCAQKNGFDLQSPMALTDFLFGLGTTPPREEDVRECRCACCGMTLSDFRKTSRLGCARCYETFAEEFSPMLLSMHRGNRHEGKVPAGARATAELESMERAMERAVVSQDFEEAARLRDLIREVKGDEALVTEECNHDRG